MNGKRVDADPNDQYFPSPHLEPGNYGKGADGVWHCRPPWKHAGGNLANHAVTEHEDGTITVAPSILITIPGMGTWHGFLERGVWREC
jgi:hypothetical protein